MEKGMVLLVLLSLLTRVAHPLYIWQMTRCVSLTTDGHRLGLERADCAPNFPCTPWRDKWSDLDLCWRLRLLFWWQNNQNLPVGSIRTFKELQSWGKWMNQSTESTSYSRQLGQCEFSHLERGRWSTGQLLRGRIHQCDDHWNHVHQLLQQFSSFAFDRFGPWINPSQ